MKPLMQVLKETISLNSNDYDFIKKEIDKRMNMDGCNMEADSFNGMMGFLFVWNETTQGHDYWQDIILRETRMQEDLLNHSHE
jgi:hypothetical protein